MLPSRPPLLVPFEICLLGRLVVNPNRPMHAFFDLAVDGDVGSYFTFREIPNVLRTFRHTSTTDVTTVSATRSTIYTLTRPSDWVVRVYWGRGFRKFLHHAREFSSSLYVVTELQTVGGYSITPGPAIGGSGVRRAECPPFPTGESSSAELEPDSIVISMTFTKFEHSWLAADVGRAMPFSIGTVTTSFLDWEHGPEHRSEIQPELISEGSRASPLDQFGGKQRDLPRLLVSNLPRNPLVDIPSGPLIGLKVRRWIPISKQSLGRRKSPFAVPGSPDSTLNPHLGDSDQDTSSNPSATSWGKRATDTTEPPQVFLQSGRISDLVAPPGMYPTEMFGPSKTIQPEPTTQHIAPAHGMHSWPIRFSRGKSNIIFPFQCRPTLANTVKGWIEQVVREPINWWPLSPRRHPLPESSVWVDWECSCGRILSTTISTERRTQYNQWITATNGTASIPRKLIPSTTATHGTATSPISLTMPAEPPSGASGIPSNSPNTSLSPAGSSSKPHKILMWCINLNVRLTVLTSLMVPLTDEQIFHDLGTQYRKTRGWRRWFSLHTISEIRFVKFAPYRVERIGAVDLVRVTCFDTEQLPAPDNGDYQYEPKPPGEIPPVAARLLMEYFEDPSCAGTSTAILEAFPLRIRGEMSRLEKHGWGLHAGEHLSFCRIAVLVTVILVGPTWFFVHWLCVYPGDLQNASVPLFLALAFIGTLLMMFDRGK